MPCIHFWAICGKVKSHFSFGTKFCFYLNVWRHLSLLPPQSYACVPRSRVEFFLSLIWKSSTQLCTALLVVWIYWIFFVKLNKGQLWNLWLQDIFLLSIPNIQLLKGVFFPLFLIHLFHAFSWTEFRTDLIVNKWVFLDTLKRMLERLGRRNWLMKMVSAHKIFATFAHFVLFLWLWSYPAWAFPSGLIKFILSYPQRIIVTYTCRNVWMPDVCGRLKKLFGHNEMFYPG